MNVINSPKTSEGVMEVVVGYTYVSLHSVIIKSLINILILLEV